MTARDCESRVWLVEVSGRWLPDGVRIERADAGRVRLRGGEHDGHDFDTVEALRQFIRRKYPGLGPTQDD
jgi:hypothetical protein